jgi:hypothetical protein
MAATNYTPIQLYYSTTASAAPTSGNLTNGELAINITDGKLYYKDNGGVVQVLATKGAGTIGGSTTQIQYNNAGALAGSAAMTFNSGTNTTTLTTLNLTNALGATYGGTAQSAYTQGDILYASATNTLSKLAVGTVNYILTSTGSVPQWVAPTSVTVNTATNLAGGAAGSVPYQSGAATTTFLAIGAADRVMTSSGTAPQWVTALTGLTGVSSSSITNTSLTSGRVVYSGASGVETDSASLTFNGTTLSAGGFSTTGLSTLVQTVTIGNSNFSGAAIFAPATPAKLYVGTGTVTDITSAASSTNTTGAISSLAITPIAATNTSVTYTNASTLYIAGAPSAGTNVTITNPYSLYVAAGAAYFGGAVTVAGAVSFGGLTVTSLTDSGLTSGRVTYATTGGLLTDSANLLFNGTTLTANTLNLTNALGTTYGGTGLTSFTSGGLVYASSTSALATGSALTFNGTNTLTLNAATVSVNLGITTSYGVVSSAGTNPAAIYFNGATRTSFGSHLQYLGTNHTFFNETGGSEIMRLLNTGNVGIGTSSPGALLEVAGATATTEIRIKGTSAIGTFNGMSIYSNNSLRAQFYHADNAGVTYLTTNVGTAQTLSIISGSNLTLTATGANIINFSTNGSEVGRFSTSGVLSIGTTNAYGRLTLNGSLQNSFQSSGNSVVNNDGAMVKYYTTNVRDASGGSSNRVTGFYAYSADEGGSPAQTMYSARYNNYYSQANINFDSQIYYHASTGYHYRAYSAVESKDTWWVKPSTIIDTVSGTTADMYLSGLFVMGTTSSVLNARNTIACAAGTQSIAFAIASGVTRASGTQYGYTIWRDNTTETNAVTFVENGGSGNNAASYVVRTNAATGGTGVTSVSGGVALVQGATSWSSYSDLRLKHDVVPITNAIDSILKIDPIFFKWNDRSEDQQRSIGVSAQSVEKVFPELIDRSGIYDVEGGAMQVRYTELIPVLLASIQEQQAIIESLKARLDAANI